MSDDTVQTLLRDTLARQGGSAPPPPAGLYDRVRAVNRRRRRRAVVATGAAVVLLVAGVSLALTGVPGANRAAPSADRPSGPNATRGSLAGDEGLRDQAVDLLTRNGAVNRDTVQVGYAEQYQGYRVVLLAGKGTGSQSDTVYALLAASPPGGRLASAVATSGTPQSIDARVGQRYLAPQSVLTRLMIGDRSFGLALFPPGFRATIARGATVGADCLRAGAAATTLPLRDGAAFFPIDNADAPNVTVYPPKPGQPAFLTRTLEVSGNSSTGTTSAPLPPPPDEIAAQIAATIRGRADVATELSQYVETLVGSVGVGELPQRYVGVWAGNLPAASGRGYAALWGWRYASGAEVLQGWWTPSNGTGFSGWLTACVPAAAVNHHVFAYRTDAPGTPLVIVGPAGGTVAEVSFGSGAPIQVPLTDGGGFLVHAGTHGQVRVLDSHGQVLGTGTIGAKLPGIPIQPR